MSRDYARSKFNNGRGFGKSLVTRFFIAQSPDITEVVGDIIVDKRRALLHRGIGPDNGRQRLIIYFNQIAAS